MTKIKILVLMILLLGLVLVACDNSDDENGDNESSDTATATDTPDNGNDDNGDTADSNTPTLEETPTEVPPLLPPDGAMVMVVDVIDGDTIDIEWHGDSIRVRYIGVNTPERNEDCYEEATSVNRELLEGQIVRLYTDTSETDQFDRMLRYVWFGNTLVNELLVELGYAEAVYYPPDTAYYERFLELEEQAAEEDLGCHPTGIFDDGTYER